MSNDLGVSSKNASWIAYILSFVSGIFILAIEKEDKTVRTHAWQSILLGIGFIALYIVLGVLGIIPFLRGILIFLRSISGAAWFIITLLCIINAVNGSILKLPLIYDIADKNA